MAQENVEISVKGREKGTRNSRNLRRQQTVPAVVYGPNVTNTSLCLALNDAKKYSSQAFENAILTLKSEEKALNGLKVLKKAVSIHPVTRLPIHIDFYAPDMKKAVRVSVEIRFTGKAEGTKEGGVFSTLRRDVEVECLPTEIPEALEVDVSALQIGEALHVSDLKIPQGVKLMTSEKEAIAMVSVVKEEVLTPQVAPAGEVPVVGAEAAPAATGEGASAEAPPAGGDAKKDKASEGKKEKA